MTFNNIDEIVVYYREYGKQLGIPVRKRTSQKGDEGELKYVTISCGQEGKYKNLQLTKFDDTGHIVGSSTSKSDGVVGTQESITMQDHQYQYWNEDYNIYMPSFNSGGSGGQRN
ncbi:hypothetical protein GBA52_015223 [Prunus armeniaca]|nr:hypothetical protein GBA52_015223 [Prunus armeniaca]